LIPIAVIRRPSGGGGTTYTVTVAYGGTAGFYGYAAPGNPDGIPPFGSISPNDGVISEFNYLTDGSLVAIFANAAGTATWNGHAYVLYDLGDGTYGYTDPGLGGPYPTSGTFDFTFA